MTENILVKINEAILKAYRGNIPPRAIVVDGDTFIAARERMDLLDLFATRDEQRMHFLYCGIPIVYGGPDAKHEIVAELNEASAESAPANPEA